MGSGARRGDYLGAMVATAIGGIGGGCADEAAALVP